MIKLYTFRWVPAFAQGHVRDLRVRWALEEAGLPYEAVLIGFEDQNTPDYRALQPFGQVPAYEEDGLQLFESGAIVQRIAERSPALMPPDEAGRARAVTWIYAALNTMEPSLANLAEADVFCAGESWVAARRPVLEREARKRLAGLSAWLGDRHYLEGRFTAGDLMMANVLRLLADTDALDEYPTLLGYRQRCEARPAFQKAFADHMAPFVENAPA